ncbi:diguanylate cyclase (GGDEF) domain-containing protein [Caulobacter sp. AP07]|uniref:putative bifunctional diguanylate cyclase/phosphodiesterase n=1 Tax=Caulobacter sp. AP07 TaxID=1144304 RepID=UPI000271EDD8|nr:EAL domain-containing protein [Caulobacter sp. AP07]EJL30800.1 diguanylate cyclase (GGDEF) domain-containing protein [Caulobacter sp. AP07]
MTVTTQATPDRFGARIVRPVAVVIVITLLTLLASAFWAAKRSDDLAMDRQRAIVQRAVDTAQQDLLAEQQIVAIWDDPVKRLAAPSPADLQWANDNIGMWLNTRFGQDEVYLLSGTNAPLYAMQLGERRPATAFASAGPDLAAMVRRLRQVSDDAITGLVQVNGKPSFVSLSKMIPLTGAARRTPGAEPVVVSVVHLEGGFAERLDRRNLLAGARFGPSPTTARGEISEELKDRGGRTIGYVSWRPALPGRSVLQVILPFSIFAFVIVAAALGLLVRNLKRSGRRLQASEAHAQHLAYHDVLTGLPNRALFADRLDQALARVRRGDEMVALLYLDLDRFKAVNDRLGHAAGDALIREFASRVGLLLRAGDTLARFGGDEFAVIQGGVRDHDSVEALCARIRQAVAEPFEILGAQAFVGVSIGVAFAPEHAGDRVELARKADIALYRAKALGRDRFEVFAEHLDESVNHRARIEAALRTAMTSGQGLAVHYQPQYANSGATLVGFEALVRWTDPTSGVMSPDHFIPIAEETGLIVELGEWVLAQACLVSARQPALTMSVNVSAVQLRAADAAERLLAVIAASGANPRAIELEITETAFLDDVESLSEAIGKLRAAGVRLALDDFGTGYSSLARLQRFAVDRIKIDGSFVRNLGSAGDSRAIVAAVINLAAALRIEVTAEGVETAEQMRLLGDLGCREMQGFLFSKAVPESQLRRMLARAAS